MKRFLVLVGALVAALVTLLGSGVSSADNEYVGKTYEQVMKATNNRAVIASRVGEYLPTEECIVTSNRRASFLDSSGNNSAKILVNLNCNDRYSVGGDGNDHPGLSAASPAAKEALKLIKQAGNISRNYANSIAAGKEPACAEYFKSCVRICTETKKCSDELNAYLGL